MTKENVVHTVDRHHSFLFTVTLTRHWTIYITLPETDWMQRVYTSRN